MSNCRLYDDYILVRCSGIRIARMLQYYFSHLMCSDWGIKTRILLFRFFFPVPLCTRLASYLGVVWFHSLPKWGVSEVISEYFITNSESNSRTSCHQGKSALLFISNLGTYFFHMWKKFEGFLILYLLLLNEEKWVWIAG